LLSENFHGRFEFSEISTLSCHPLDIAPESCGLPNP
jgi:hypothetical protein